MCGIAGFYFHDPLNPPISQKKMEKLANELLLEIEHRGTDATGVAAVTPSAELFIEKADLEATRFNWWRGELPDKPQTVLLHTRMATKGTPMVLENNHPIHYEDVLVTHNGHISNDDELFNKEDLHRNAEVDSEIIAALFQKYGIDKAHIPLGKLDGNYAVAVSDLRKPNTLILAKGWSSPLYYYSNDEGLMWASTDTAILDAAKNALDINIKRSHIDFLNWGQLLLIEDGKVEKLKFKPYEKPKPKYTYPMSTDTFAKRWDRDLKKERETTVTDPKHIEFWQNESHPIAYTVKSGNNTFIFKKCDGCEVAYQTTLLELDINGNLFCSTCVKEILEESPLGESPAVVHEVVCELVAEKYSTNADFVNWLLFDSDDDDIDPSKEHSLVNMYVLFSDEYNDIYEQLTGDRQGAAQRWADIAEEIEQAELIEEEEICGVEAFEDKSVEIAKTGLLDNSISRAFLGLFN